MKILAIDPGSASTKITAAGLLPIDF